MCDATFELEPLDNLFVENYIITKKTNYYVIGNDTFDGSENSTYISLMDRVLKINVAQKCKLYVTYHKRCKYWSCFWEGKTEIAYI